MSKTSLLSSLFWDMQISEAEIKDLLAANDIKLSFTASLYSRILTSFKWYDILELLSEEQLKNALSDRVIRSLPSRHLRELYKYAASRLFLNN